VPICAACGQENPEGFRFCGACAAPLAETPAPREQRKRVSVLFCDVTGSTALGEQLDPEALRRVMRRYFDEIAAVVERHGGTVEKFIGDAVMAVFGIPQVREDDALRAVRAAAEIRERLPAVGADLGFELSFRTGVNTGDVVVGSGQTLATGDAVNVAARLEQAAQPGEILLGAETKRLVRDAVEVEVVEPLALKGKSEPVAAYRLLNIDPNAAAVARHLDAPLVGRGRELDLLRAAFERSVDEQSCHLFTLLGPAGVGKSRLVAEFLGGLADRAMVVRGRCLHYGDGITFWPLVEILVQLGDVAAPTLERVTEGGTASPEDLFWEVRRQLELVATERPLVAVFDDLHWAEPMLLDLLDHVADLSRGSPLVLLCLARPELLDSRPGWAGGKLHATTVLLEPLPTADCERLLDALGDGLDPETRERVVAASEGNPLFLEEMAAFAREGGDAAVPPTIQALLAARLEQLPGEERAVIERGAVEGKIFHRGAVRELAPDRLRAGVGTQLAALVRKELIRPEPPTVAGEDAFRFRHLLIRDAAYEALPKEERAELHERFANWLVEHGADLVELDEIAGWHLEEAVRYRREIGLPVDVVLASHAGEHLAAAGRKAAARMDVRAVDKLLTRSLELLEPEHADRPAVALSLAEALTTTGQLDRVPDLLDLAAADDETRPYATVVRITQLVSLDPDDAVALAERELPAVLARFHETGDERGLAQAHMARFWIEWLASRAGPAAEAVSAVAEHARRAGDRAILGDALGWLCATAMWGPADADEMRETLAKVEVEREQGGAWVTVATEYLRARLASLEGRFEEARAHNREAQRILIDYGLGLMAAARGIAAAETELAAETYVEAAALLRSSYDALHAMEERSFLSTVCAMLAQALYGIGDAEAAERAARESEELSGATDAINFAIGRGVRARIHADRGELDRAEALARSGVEYAESTDFPQMRGEAQQALAHVLLAAGKREAAASALSAAITIYEGKGDRVRARRARALAAELGGG
jgi:class 3 adenylate cyclase